VDGGVRNIAPLADAIKSGAEDILVITCSPRQPAICRDLYNGKLIAMRALDIMLNEIFVNDLEQTLRINRLVKEAKKRHSVLHNASGRKLKAVNIRIIEPTADMGETLDLSRDMALRRLRHGWDRTQQI